MTSVTQLKRTVLHLSKVYRAEMGVESDYFTVLLESFDILLNKYADLQAVLTSLVEHEGYICFHSPNQYKCNYCSKVLVEHRGNEAVYYPHDINCPVVQAKMLLGGK